jgi:hypothetical protein
MGDNISRSFFKKSSKNRKNYSTKKMKSYQFCNDYNFETILKMTKCHNYDTHGSVVIRAKIGIPPDRIVKLHPNKGCFFYTLISIPQK